MDIVKIAQKILDTPAQIGNWGMKNYIYDPETGVDFPSGYIGRLAQARKRYPEGPERNKAMQEAILSTAIMMSSSPVSTKNIYPKELNPIVNKVKNNINGLESAYKNIPKQPFVKKQIDNQLSKQYKYIQKTRQNFTEAGKID